MKKSKYSYFFEEGDELIAYSALCNEFEEFHINQKRKIEDILNYPDEIITNSDYLIYKKLVGKFFIIPDYLDEYKQMVEMHRKAIYRQDKIMFTICPTMACNLRCKYCYEAHAELTESTISREVIDNIKKHIESKIGHLNECTISWFGGEPLYCPEIIEEISDFCIKLCKKNKVQYSSGMTSNFALATKKVISMLTKSKIHNIQVTLDGYKENHDLFRVTKNNKGTWDLLVKNILCYLNYDKRNSITLRIHFPDTADEIYLNNTLKDLQVFDKELRNRIGVYPHAVFSSCTDTWDNSDNNANKKTKASPVVFNKLLEKFRKEVFQLGFQSNVFNIKPYYCEADLDYFWTVRPDGYLSKCTVALEKERAQAVINKTGVKILNNKILDFHQKDHSMYLYKECSECSYLLFCWRGCGYALAEEKELPKGIEPKCGIKHNNWMMERQIDNIRYKYLHQKRNILNHEN